MRKFGYGTSVEIFINLTLVQYKEFKYNNPPRLWHPSLMHKGEEGGG